MSVPLSGYSTTRLLRASTRTAVYEAERKRDGRRVLAKVFDVEDDAAEARVAHEFRLLQQLDIDGVVRALGVERAGRQVVLLLEYVPGRNLAQQAGGEPVTVDRFLPQAREMAAILARIHERRIIHRDIKPSNVLVERGTGKIVFADFGISVLLEDEQRRLHDPEVLQGTLPYVSPEQTGRTGREVDFRSDLYSLGVTFYELLTGHRPFESSAPLELIHAHLAQRPQPPNERVTGIPDQLSAIVMKLLEKAPEHRYQSARGLAADLDRLAEALARGEPEPRFPLAERDVAAGLQLPHQLYGRERERAVLERELLAVIETGRRRLVLVSGPPGAGKSALLRSFDPLLGRHRGSLGLGHFEHGSGDGEQPYRGFVEALAGILAQILTESDDALRSWRSRLLAALGPIAGVVGDLIPELALIVGELEPVPELELGEARNRLHLALTRFVATLADAGPVVLVLDDLQWADAASLELLGSLMLDTSAPVLFVGAYRSEDVDEAHPLEVLAAELGSDALPVTRLSVPPLSNRAVEELLVDVLGRAREHVVPLAELIGRKTDNNPLLIRQYLVMLADAGLIRPAVGGWAWELDAIAGAGIPDDLVGVMRAKLERVPAAARELLEIAACVGARFEPSLLEAVGAGRGEALVAGLYELERAGLIGRSGAGYRFVHERVRAAARERLAPERRRQIHARIAAELLVRHPAPDRGDAVFAIADQLDASILEAGELSGPERDSFAAINLEAGLRALHSAAWRSALGYLALADQVLAGRQDPLAFEARFGLAQARALVGVQDESLELGASFDELLRWPLSLLDYARVTARRVRILQLQGRASEALERGREGLARCGVRLPDSPSLPQLLVALVAAWRTIKGLRLAELMALPEATDERAIATMLLLAAVKPVAFTFDQNLYSYLTALHAKLTVRAGYHPSSVEGLAQLTFAAVAMGQGEAAVRLCDDVVELANQRETSVSAWLSARSMQVLFVGPTGRPIRESAAVIEDHFNAAMEAGDRLNAGYVASLGLWLQVEAGMHLAEVRAAATRMRSELPDMGSRETLTIADTVGRFIDTISAELDQTPPDFLALDEIADADISPVSRYALIVAEVWGRMMFGDHTRARALMDGIADDFEKVLFGTWAVPRAAMFDAILVGEQARAALGRDRRRLIRRMRKRLATTERWAAGHAENYGPMADIVASEIAWAEGEIAIALDRLERARASASDSGRAYLAVFACLRIANLAGAQGWTAVEQGALVGAHAALVHWGAWAAVLALEREHPGLAGPGSTASPARSRATHDTGSGGSSGRRFAALPGRRLATHLLPGEGTPREGSSSSVSSLDLATVLGTVQAITEDLRLEEVIGRVLGSAIENAGADRGALLLERGGGVVVVAEGAVAVGPHESGSSTTAHLGTPIPLAEAGERIPTAVVHYVLRTGEPVVLDDVREDARFAHDDYVARTGARSLLCMPIVKQGERVGALVLENRLTTRAFTEERLETLEILVGQAASALDNARLYAQLQRSEAQWRSLVDGVPDIIALLDEQGRVEFVNHLAGYANSPTELTGLTAEAFMDAGSVAAWRASLAEVVATGERRELELCIAAPGEPRRWFMTRIAPVEMAGGGSANGARYLSIATDVTARKDLESQLRQQQRLESVGTLASGVAHEINNPVQGILNYAELITERAGDASTVRDFAREITHESNRVAAIVRNLLAFSRQESEQRLEPCEVRALVEDTLSLVRAVLRKDQIGVELDIPDGLPPLRCRVQQIQQIIMNLVTNARDALNERYAQFDEAKRITIRARSHPGTEPGVGVAGAEAGAGAGWVRISVEDRAGGIPEDIRARIFDPFFTTKSRDQGTGLGLAVSHGIAAEHGGALSVDSEIGAGSRFHLDLPAGRGPEARDP